MEASSGTPLTLRSAIFFSIFLVMFHVVIVQGDTPEVKTEFKGYNFIFDCGNSCNRKEQGRWSHFLASDTGDQGEKDFEIIAAYTDSAGNIRTSSVKTKELSASWVWENPEDRLTAAKTFDDSLRSKLEVEGYSENSTGEQQAGEGGIQQPQTFPMDPVKLWRKKLRQERRDFRTAELMQHDEESDKKMEAAAITRSLEFDNKPKAKYGIWRRDYASPNADSILRLMRDQIIMAKVYASIAKSKNDNRMYDSLISHIRRSQSSIGEANSDAELHSSALDQAKAIGRAISRAKDQFYDCSLVARKLRALVQATEDSVTAQKKLSTFLTQLAAKVIPKPLHCLSLLLTTDYFMLDHESRPLPNKDKIEDPSLYHYAIFSDNVLAASVVVNSTALHATEIEKHVFHIVTDRLNFAAMKMWFLENSPANVTVQVENIDDFKWLNASYCSVLRQLESARVKDFYFKANHPTTLSAGAENLKYRNPKYLSMLNHLRFYLPEVYPKLDKILFLDDDVVVQKDLTPLWSIDLRGMVNGAVETCKQSFHTFDKYLNFSHPLIESNFDANACGWAFGMNLFDLKEWRKRNLTGIYHHWQDLNENRTLWKLGSLPPGLITFYNMTYPLDRSWHVLGLGYDPALNQTLIQNAAVVHYNGNYKPWLELVLTKYKKYWTKYVMLNNPYFRRCNIIE